MLLSPHFSLEELTRSDYALRHGLDNTAPPFIVEKLKRTASGLERIRAQLGVRIFVTSGYRSPAVNRGIGGTEHSQHCKGEAADFTAPAYGSPRDVCLLIAKYGEMIDFDQLIHEGNWVHCSFAENPRRDVRTAHFFKDRQTIYTQGIA